MNSEYEIQCQHFAALKDKYQANNHQDSSPSSPLYFILRKADLGVELTDFESIYLQKEQLSTTFNSIQKEQQHRMKTRVTLDVEFTKLKSKYKVENYNISWITSPLYFILCKIDSGDFLSEKELNWLVSHGFKQANSIGIETRRFINLKSKYKATEYQDSHPDILLYSILKKIDISERLIESEYKWLQDNQLSETLGFVKQTGNKWNLANASSHLRKADKSELALQLTNNLPLNNIKDNKLKSALLTTRGGAFRDIDKLGDAEICAREAMNYQPDSHHPYTLMGAICFERHQYADGEYWFNEAIKRGANPRDTDSEIKSVLKKTKDEKQRHELVYYLLRKDSYRYAWAKDYLKKQKDKK
ncbi:hypothetical protein FJR11_18850 [Anabaena sp. UHCC 0187]|uniref:hypothetical protein n=1 Tax=Anabaena sp. UHCC 0187 TaxID=2590018 RepID=UPI001444AF6E|nr:hypothetical protein [Anabaena sp. UHCC 0187]MTJ14596.1 hypothetical protein [Anabaena sp. UHCC 0187]